MYEIGVEGVVVMLVSALMIRIRVHKEVTRYLAYQPQFKKGSVWLYFIRSKHIALFDGVNLITCKEREKAYRKAKKRTWEESDSVAGGVSDDDRGAEWSLLLCTAGHRLILYTCLTSLLAVTFAIFDASSARRTGLMGVVLGNFEYGLHVVLDHFEVGPATRHTRVTRNDQHLVVARVG